MPSLVGSEMCIRDRVCERESYRRGCLLPLGHAAVDANSCLGHQRQHGPTLTNNCSGGGWARHVHLQYASASLTGAVVNGRRIMLPVMPAPLLHILGGQHYNKVYQEYTLASVSEGYLESQLGTFFRRKHGPRRESRPQRHAMSRGKPHTSDRPSIPT